MTAAPLRAGRRRTTIGVVGTGNMGSALVKGLLRAPETEVDLVVWDKVEESVRRLPASGRISAAASLDDLAARADVVAVVVKPKDAGEVLGELAGRLREDQAVISAMAGVTAESIRRALGPGPPLYRIMPNLGVELGVGAVAIASEPGTSGAGLPALMELLKPLGHVESVPEELLDVVTAVSGSGPAFLALAMESLEDGAVAAGLSRQAARIMVQEAALTTARLLPLHSDSPLELKQHLMEGGDVSGAALEVLEERTIRAAFQHAVEAALERSRQLGGTSRQAGRAGQ